MTLWTGVVDLWMAGRRMAAGEAAACVVAVTPTIAR
jgi:hypothetical protein